MERPQFRGSEVFIGKDKTPASEANKEKDEGRYHELKNAAIEAIAAYDQDQNRRLLKEKLSDIVDNLSELAQINKSAVKHIHLHTLREKMTPAHMFMQLVMRCDEQFDEHLSKLTEYLGE